MRELAASKHCKGSVLVYETTWYSTLLSCSYACTLGVSCDIRVCVCVYVCVCVCVCVCNVLQYRAYVILVQQVGRRLRQTPPPPHISRLHHQTPTLLKVSERLFNKRGVKRSCPQATD
jgi:hypothetical protein